MNNIPINVLIYQLRKLEEFNENAIIDVDNFTVSMNKIREAKEAYEKSEQAQPLTHEILVRNKWVAHDQTDYRTTTTFYSKGTYRLFPFSDGIWKICCEYGLDIGLRDVYKGTLTLEQLMYKTFEKTRYDDLLEYYGSLGR